MSNWLGLGISYAFIFLVIGISTLLLRSGRVSAGAARKIIHIGVSNWWIIAMLTMDDPWIASIGPLTFIIINLVSLRTGLFSAMEDGKEERNWGTVYFPISLLVLVNLCFRGLVPLYVGGIATLIMGWGDGLAAVVGSRYGKTHIGFTRSPKTLAGTVTMFAVSVAVTASFAFVFEPATPLIRRLLLVPLGTAAVATGVELFTPFGIDNITVPFACTAFYRLVVMSFA